MNGDHLGSSRLDYALFGVLAMVWLAVAWMAINGVPALSPVACLLSGGLVLTACLLGLLLLGRRCRRAEWAERQAMRMVDVLSQALDTVPFGVQIKDADLRYVWVGAQHERRTGYSATRMLGKIVEEIGLDPAMAAAVTAHDRRVLASGEAGDPEEQVTQGEDGRLKYISLITKMPLLRDGKVSHIVSLAADLQQWREAQMRAEEVRRLLETVLDAAPVTIQVTDHEYRLRWANRAFCEHIGWRTGSPVGMLLTEAAPGRGPLPEALEAHRAVLAGQQPIAHLKQHFPATDQNPEQHLLTTKMPIHDAAGAIVQVLTVGTDVTALVQAEAAAETANRLVEGILRHVPVSVQVKDADLRYRWVNHAFTNAANQDAAVILGKTVDDLPVPSNSKLRTNDMDRKVLASGETMRFDQQWIVNGTARQMMVIKTPMLDATGRATHVITIGADITELHRLQAEVNESRHQLQAVLDAVPVTLALKDTNRRYLWVNRVYEQVFGYSSERLTGLRMEDIVDDPILAAKVANADNAAFAGGLGSHLVTQRHLSPDGRTNDFSVKRHIMRDADGKIEGLLVVGMEVTELMRTTVELQRLNEELEHRVAERAGELAKMNAFVALMIERAPVPIVAIGLDGLIRSWNPAAARATGYSEAEALNQSILALFPEDREYFAQKLRLMRRGIFKSNVATRRKRRDGKMSEFLVSSAPMTRDDGTVDGAITIWLDVTEQRAAERQLRQAQKMEAIGQLTGNVAHDFNNLLAVVIGNLDLLLEALPPDGAERELVNNAIDAAERGAALTERLLAFARPQILRPVTLNPVTLIDGMRPLLAGAVGEAIAIHYASDSDPWLAKVDPGLLESAILNLSINARDAMPAGGTLTIAVCNATPDEVYAVVGRTDAADYVCVSVSDTGTGMAPEVLGHMFEPFFTTKGAGKGTGLGLSIVYGFVKQSGGHVHVTSEVGQGTCIKLYLPRVTGVVEQEDATATAIVQGHGETILLVEDDPQLRRISTHTLQRLGYAVVAAGNGKQALALLDLHPQIRLMLSDVVLSAGMNGFDLAREACRLKPGLKVLFISGFVDPSLIAEPQDGHEIKILTKPFRRVELSIELSAALNKQRHAADASERENQQYA